MSQDHEEDLARPIYRDPARSFINMVDSSGQLGIRGDTSMISRLADDGTDPEAVTKDNVESTYDEKNLEKEAQVQALQDDAAYSKHRARELRESDMANDEDPKVEDGSARAQMDLAEQVRKVFSLPEGEEVLEHYPAWLLKSVMLQGHIYMMTHTLCFYSYIPRKEDITIKSGFLYKKSRTSRRYHRHWFILKNNILSYYDSPSDLYFAGGNIDLRRATMVLADVQNSVNGGFGFKLITSDREYYLRADTASSVSEWIKILQKVMFRLNNDGDSVKITIPVASILDIEESNILKFTKTMKIKIADDHDTFAINEYYFSLFSSADRIMQTLRKRIHEVQSRPGSSSASELPASVSLSILDTSVSAPGYRQPEMFENLTEAMRTVNIETFGNHLLSEAEKERGPLPAFSKLTKDSAKDTIHHEDHTSFEDVKAQAANYSLEQDAARFKGRSKTLGSRLKNVGLVASSVIHAPMHLFTSKDTHEEDPGAEDQAAAADFRFQFGLPDDERLLKVCQPFLFLGLPLHGDLYIGDAHICFKSSTPGTKKRILLPLADVETARAEKGFRFGFSGLVLNIRAHEDMFFEFAQSFDRNQCIDFINGALENLKSMQARKDSKAEMAEKRVKDAEEEHQAIEQATKAAGGILDGGQPPENVIDVPAVIFDSPNSSMLGFKPLKQLRFTCLTIGSRGDVQPYIALCKGLIADGQKAKIVTHEEFRDFVKGHGIDFEPIDGNPAELMAICVEHGMFTYSFLKEASQKFRGWIDDLLKSSWKACQNTDVLIESPSAMGGIHIAEGLGIPYFRAFTMPWSKTRVYPHAFAVLEHDMGGNYNAFTYSAFDTLFWKAISGQVNRWRKKSLNLPPTNFEKMAQHKVPFLYNFSPSVVPPAIDWHEWIRVTGYWFLDGSDDTSGSDGKKWEPPEEVVKFIKKARDEEKKLIYIGFGSIVVSDPRALTRAVIQAVKKSGVRCILVKGWSARSKTASDDDKSDSGSEDDDENNRNPEHANEKSEEQDQEDFGHEILSLDSIPHDWLFPQIDVACHHGGAGSLGASLRAGVPTIVKPFFGDQYFFGDRVNDLGVGLCLRKLTVKGLRDAIHTCTTNTLMIQKAQKIGEQIRSEKGVENAIQNIYRDLEYAKSLVKRPERSGQSEMSEESWCDVGDAEDATEDDDGDLFESTTDANGQKSSILKPFKSLKLPNPLGERSHSYGLSGIRLFKGKAEVYKMRRR